jgi:hypothetical protein
MGGSVVKRLRIWEGPKGGSVANRRRMLQQLVNQIVIVMDTFCDIVSSSSDKINLQIDGREIPLSRSTVIYSLYGLMKTLNQKDFITPRY